MSHISRINQKLKLNGNVVRTEGSGMCELTNQRRLGIGGGLKARGIQTESLRKRGKTVLLYEKTDVVSEHERMLNCFEPSSKIK